MGRELVWLENRIFAASGCSACACIHGVPPMITHSQDQNWISIAERVTVEMDSAKLAILVERLCGALDDRKKSALPLTGQTNP